MNKVKVQPIVIILAFIVLVLVYKTFYRIRVEKEGVFTVAKVLDIEVGKSGSSCKIEIYLRRKRFVTFVPGKYCGYDCIGNYFFVRVLVDNVKMQPMLYVNKPVPACILDSLDYFNGWNSIPDCRTFRSEMLTE